MTSDESCMIKGGKIVLATELDEITSHLESVKTVVTRIGLQVPEGLKRAAVELVMALEERTGVEVVLSANPCFGACDLDRDLLDFVDVLFHVGHTPMVKCDDVVYLTHRMDIPWVDAVKDAVPLLSGRVGLATSAQHAHRLREVRDYLVKKGIDASTGIGSDGLLEGQVLGCNFSALPRDADVYLFVGGGSFHPLGIALAMGKPVVHADLEMGVARKVDADDFVKRRYMAIARAMDSKRWGVIVGEKPGQRYLTEALELKRKLPGAVLLALNSITPAALEGLPFDAYVVCACPRIALDDGQRFEKPVLTPGEALAVLGECGIGEVDFYRGYQSQADN